MGQLFPDFQARFLGIGVISWISFGVGFDMTFSDTWFFNQLWAIYMGKHVNLIILYIKCFEYIGGGGDELGFMQDFRSVERSNNIPLPLSG